MAKQKPASLTENLNSFLEGHIYPEKRRISSCQQRIIDRVVAPILKVVGEKDDRFCTDVPSTSDCRFGVTSNEEHNFDILVPLRNLLTKKRHDVPSSGEHFTYINSRQCGNPYVAPQPGFGFLTTDTTATFLQDLSCTVDSDVGCHDNGQPGSFLMPGKVLRRFHCLTEEAVNALEQKCFWEREPTVYQVTTKTEGPAEILTVLMRGNTYTISLLPAVNITPWPEEIPGQWPRSTWMTCDRIESVKRHFYLLAIRAKGSSDARKLWCSCYYPGESLLASQADSGSSIESCRRHVLDAILALHDENPQDFLPVSARIIRTIFLHQCVQYPHDEDWEPHKLGRAFVDLFLALIQALIKGTCPHFFLADVDLLSKFDQRDLKSVANHLKMILNDVVQSPDKTRFLGDVRGRRQFNRLKHTCAPTF